jgi:putative transposase
MCHTYRESIKHFRTEALLVGMVMALVITACYPSIVCADEPVLVEASPETTQLNLPEQVELRVLISLVSEQLGLQIVFDDKLGGQRVTIKTPREVPTDSLRGILESALQLNGLALVEDDQPGWLRIVEAKDLTRLSGPPTVGQDACAAKRGCHGYDAGKKITGRKRHICVDTLGLILEVSVHAGDVQDRDGGDELLLEMVGRFTRLKRIWADGGYAGEFVQDAKWLYGRIIEIVKRSDLKRFVVLPKRWIVERTFAWLGKYRRLSKDYETLPQSSRCMIHFATINLMLHRLQPG